MSGLYGLLAMAVYVVAILGFVMFRDKGLAWRFEEELGAGSRERESLGAMLERRLGPAGAPLIRRIQLDNPVRREKVRQRIDAAGRPGGLTLERYALRKGAFLVLGVGLALFALVSGSLLSAFALLFVGVIGFDAWLHGTGRRRQEAIERGLPDFLDILAVCVSAGIAFRCARRWSSCCARSRWAPRGARRSTPCVSATRPMGWAPSSPPSSRLRNSACRSPTRSWTSHAICAKRPSSARASARRRRPRACRS
jgi:hypothetical protein